MDSLNKAIITENRRIRKEIITRNTLKETAFSLPKRKFSIKEKIIEVYRNLTDKFKADKKKNKISYNEFVNNNRDEKILSFLPLLYLEEQKKVWLEQEKPFEEVYIWLKEVFLKHNPDPFADLKEDLEEYNKMIEDIDEDFKEEERKDEEE
jgi:chromatin segregation and condensation protein Rec8/ScpA/Scc1 (kleisin family)